MRIISKVNDYYDSVQAYGADDRLLMIREPALHTSKEPKFRSLIEHFGQLIRTGSRDLPRNSSWSSLSIRTSVVLFVGKPYPLFEVMRVNNRTFPYSKDQRFIYDLPELEALLLEHDDGLGKQRRRPYSWASTLFRAMSAKSFEREVTELQAPIIRFYERDKCVTYPTLKDIEFFRIMPPWKAYQELSMFLGNIAAPDLVPVTVADKDRIQQHGFDRYSFRKRPA